MLNVRYYIKFTSLLVLVTCPEIVSATQTYQTSNLTIVLKSTRPLPHDLVPLLYNENLYGEIHSLEPHSPNITKMLNTAPFTFTAQVRWSEPEIAVAIDHPGFLRGFSIPISAYDTTTQTIELPAPGSLRAILELQHIRAGNRSHYADAEWHCITSYLTRQGPNSYQIHNPVIPLPKWKLDYDDLAPGKYRIFATGRYCQKPEYAEASSSTGPAGTAAKSYFIIKSGHLTELGLPIFTRPEFEKSDSTSPTLSVKPISLDP